MGSRWPLEFMILGIDQGTTGTTAVVFDRSLEVVTTGYATVERTTPEPGRVEVAPESLLESVTTAVADALADGPVDAEDVAAVGLANQGETSLCWDRDGDPLHDALVWQDRRTADRCARLADDEEFASYVRETTGLRIDPYFSATKLEWLLGELDPDDPSAIRCGTTDTWLLRKLVAGEPYVTDHATASRTMLYDVDELAWDDRLREEFGLEDVELPEPVPTDHVVGRTDPSVLSGIDAPVAGCIVDQQAALYGHGCTAPGDAKCTYGTGSFLLMNVGDRAVVDSEGVLGTVAWTLDGETSYALDGGIYTTGAFVDWLVEDLELLESPAESGRLARSVDGSNGVAVVPALSGLAAPYWDADARGAFVGLDTSTRRAHVVRAGLEGIAHRVRDVVDAMVADAGVSIGELRVDGGLTANEFLLQYQADVLGQPLSVSAITEATALGTAALAARATGLDVDPDGIGTTGSVVRPESEAAHESADATYERWRRALEAVRSIDRS